MTHHNLCLIYAIGQSLPRAAEGEILVLEQFKLNNVVSNLNHPIINSSRCRATLCAPTCLYGQRTVWFVFLKSDVFFLVVLWALGLPGFCRSSECL